MHACSHNEMALQLVNCLDHDPYCNAFAASWNHCLNRYWRDSNIKVVSIMSISKFVTSILTFLTSIWKTLWYQRTFGIEYACNMLCLLCGVHYSLHILFICCMLCRLYKCLCFLCFVSISWKCFGSRSKGSAYVSRIYEFWTYHYSQ